MDWQADGFILSVKSHGETSAIVNVFTREQGVHAGLVRGGRSRRMRPVLQVGNKVNVRWNARLAQHLGSFVVEPLDAHAALIMENRLSLSALNACAAVTIAAIPEREAHERLYDVLDIFLSHLGDQEIWPALYVRYEIALLHALGYGLDLASCAATGTIDNLTHVSPRSGRAVCADAAQPYLDRMLRLPAFLKENTGLGDTDLADGLALSGHFIEKRVFHGFNKAVPESRYRLIQDLKAAKLV